MQGLAGLRYGLYGAVEFVVFAGQAAGGNVSRLANLLNVSRVTLYRYLKKYNLEKK